MCFFFFFKQKTAYEMVSCDWSSDVCSSDLEHAAAPDRDAVGHAEVMDPPRLEVAADPARLDVHDLAGAEPDRGRGGLRRDDRLVEAHGRLDQPREVGVAE